ncbi:c-type cytochrome [Edaphocola flava]|uniref:c-type cytochrome n=1 Tax=Edaphocola flava TaxID=2499629 RepID=UPI001F354A51|nr:c-type cytochrome [Edaphocola flava]
MALIAVLTVFGSFTQANAQDGKALFQANCASCHNPIKDATGPALQGITGRAPSTEWIHKWVKNSAAVIASGDKYANGIYTKWNKTAMTAFPNLKEEEIDAIIKYVEEYKPPTTTPSGGDTAGSPAKEADNTWLYVLVTIVLAVLALILIRINKGLHKVANTEQGIPNKKDVPLKRNKVFIAVVGILLFILAGYWMVNGGVEMGRQQNYMPKQPIFYSHKVHAGINQINCQYCHAGVNDSRQAMIPSTNVCMNCHKQIGEYTGEQLFDHEGNKIDGTAQIQELYKYAGWDPAKKEYKRDNQGKILATPIKWTKIHNLADFVYFNHSQHVRVGKVQCQTCHGPIQEMDEVKQFESLSMGWCINCHRETKVDFQNNNYYSIFEKYHQEIKDGKRDGVTEAELGGLECQKCHY